MTQRGGGVLCLGRIYLDLVFSGLDAFPAPGREVYADRLTLHAGGGAFITAAYLAALGRPAELSGLLPAAPFDATVRAEAAANGVGLAAAAPAEGVEPQLTVALTGQGDRAFLTRRSGPALPPLDVALALPGLRHVHLGELATLVETPEVLPLARARGLTVSADCGWDEAVFGAPELPELLAALDVFLPNEAEAAALLEAGVVPRQQCLAAVKLGAAGAEARQGDRRIAAPAEPAEAVDTIGAGDAFNAGFLHAWLEGAPLSGALALGNACGAVAVRRRGGAGRLPSLAALARGTEAAE